MEILAPHFVKILKNVTKTLLIDKKALPLHGDLRKQVGKLTWEKE